MQNFRESDEANIHTILCIIVYDGSLKGEENQPNEMDLMCEWFRISGAMFARAHKLNFLTKLYANNKNSKELEINKSGNDESRN